MLTVDSLFNFFSSFSNFSVVIISPLSISSSIKFVYAIDIDSFSNATVVFFLASTAFFIIPSSPISIFTLVPANIISIIIVAIKLINVIPFGFFLSIKNIFYPLFCVFYYFHLYHIKRYFSIKFKRHLKFLVL